MTKITAALVVQNCPAGRIEDNLAQTIAFAQQAAARNARIVVFPEMNLTGYDTGKKVLTISRQMSDPLITPLVSCAVENKITILAGLAEITQKKKIYATHLVISPDGKVRKYRKTHTAPFEQEYYSRGSAVPVFDAAGLRFGLELCYDAHFPELTQALALQGAHVVFIPHASPRGTSQEKYDSWLRHLTARAFDNAVYIAACNQTGDNRAGLNFPGLNLLIGPDGRVAACNLDGDEGFSMVTIDLSFLEEIRSHKMRYFLPNRRSDLFGVKQQEE